MADCFVRTRVQHELLQVHAKDWRQPDEIALSRISLPVLDLEEPAVRALDLVCCLHLTQSSLEARLPNPKTQRTIAGTPAPLSRALHGPSFLFGHASASPLGRDHYA